MSGNKKIEFISHHEEVGPACIHGPAILLRQTDKSTGQSKEFFACSAYRNQKDCKFINKDRSKRQINRRHYRERLKAFLSLNRDKRKYCRRCNLLLIEEDQEYHQDHDLMHLKVSDVQNPVSRNILTSLEHNKKEAQYYFTDQTVKFLAQTFEKLGYSNILCIGTPTMHEYLQRKGNQMKSLLLDLDDRLYQFFLRRHFLKYNMFNHHFFEGKKAERVFESFLKDSTPSRLLVICDPPFSGLIEPLFHSLESINYKWCSLNGLSDTTSFQLPVILFFPYFNEKIISNTSPFLSMLDYKVNYKNHSNFNTTHKQGSIVRMFVKNIDISSFVLPKNEGYKYCESCNKYVSRENEHCDKCGTCTSKDGRPSKHCDICKRCYKITWIHCNECKRCKLPHKH